MERNFDINYFCRVFSVFSVTTMIKRLEPKLDKDGKKIVDPVTGEIIKEEVCKLETISKETRALTMRMGAEFLVKLSQRNLWYQIEYIIQDFDMYDMARIFYLCGKNFFSTAPKKLKKKIYYTNSQFFHHTATRWLKEKPKLNYKRLRDIVDPEKWYLEVTDLYRFPAYHSFENIIAPSWISPNPSVAFNPCFPVVAIILGNGSLLHLISYDRSSNEGAKSGYGIASVINLVPRMFPTAIPPSRKCDNLHWSPDGKLLLCTQLSYCTKICEHLTPNHFAPDQGPEKAIKKTTRIFYYNSGGVFLSELDIPKLSSDLYSTHHNCWINNNSFLIQDPLFPDMLDIVTINMCRERNKFEFSRQHYFAPPLLDVFGCFGCVSEPNMIFGTAMCDKPNHFHHKIKAFVNTSQGWKVHHSICIPGIIYDLIVDHKNGNFCVVWMNTTIKSLMIDDDVMIADNDDCRLSPDERPLSPYTLNDFSFSWDFILPVDGAPRVWNCGAPKVLNICEVHINSNGESSAVSTLISKRWIEL